MDEIFKVLMMRERRPTENFDNISDLRDYLSSSKEFLNLVQKKKMIPSIYLDIINETNYKKFQDNKELIMQNFFLITTKLDTDTDIYRVYSLYSETLNKDQIQEKQKRLFRNFLEVFLSDKSNSISIPHIHHRVWITSSETPYDYPDDLMEKYVKSIDNFDESWTHYFWCINTYDIPNMIKTLNKNPKIIIRSIYEIIDQFKTKNLFWSLYNKKYYSFACDYAKVEIVNIFGGAYFDLGFEILKCPNFFLNFDYSFYYRNIFKNVPNFDISFFVSSKGSKITEKFLLINSNLQTFPEEFKEKFNNILGLSSIKYFLFYFLIPNETNEYDKILFYQSGDIMTSTHQNSWSENPKFGNKNCLVTTNDIIIE